MLIKKEIKLIRKDIGNGKTAIAPEVEIPKSAKNVVYHIVPMTCTYEIEETAETADTQKQE